MNALQNMACVKSGSSTLKEQSIIAMNNVLSSAREHIRQSGNAEKLAKADREIAEVNAKAEALPESFFAGVDCDWNREGKAILQAVMKA